MQLTDNRKKKPKSKFGNLQIGTFFVDENDDICIKTDDLNALYWTGPEGWQSITFGGDEIVTIVEAILTINDM